MDCEKFSRYLDNYADLTEEEILEMNSHASKCERCAKELDFMLSVMETLRTLPDIEPPSDFMENLNARIDAEEKKRKLVSRAVTGIRRNWKQYTALAACFALVAVLTANSNFFTERLSENDVGVISDAEPVNDNSIPSAAPIQTEQHQEPVVSDSTLNVVPEKSLPDKKTDNKPAVRPQKYETNTVASARASEQPKRESTEAAAVPQSEVQEPQEADNIAAASIGAEDMDNQIAAFSDDVPVSQPEGRSMPKAYGARSTVELASVEEAPEEDSTIGKLQIPSEDETDAMEVIMRYSDEVDGDFYTTSPDKMVQMFCDLVDRGVDYANYTPDYSDLIKFQLVIG